MLISLLFTVIDEIRRWFAVTRPVRYIVKVAEKIMNGDFSVRVTPIRSLDSQDGFNVIIDLSRYAGKRLGACARRARCGYSRRRYFRQQRTWKGQHVHG